MGPKTQCVMCSAEIEEGILCNRCDGPLQSRRTTPPDAAPAEPPAVPAAAPAISATSDGGGTPEEIRQILEAIEAAAIIFDSSGRLLSMSREAREILRYGPGERPGTLEMETRLGMKVTRVTRTETSTSRIGGIDYQVTTVLIAGGSSGRVVLLRSLSDTAEDIELAFLQETVIGPLKSLNSTLRMAARQRGSDHLLTDAVSTIDQALSSLELSPDFSGGSRLEPVSMILETLKARYEPSAESKGVNLQVESIDPQVEVEDARGLSNAVGIYLENSLQYVPRGGQIAFGARRMEHKGSPIILFFVMDNGPVIPPEKRESIFSPDYTPASANANRTAVRFAEVRGYALSRGGKAWMEAKTGKACTFFLSVSA
ncbi:MAG: hypothetical protein KY432_03845 [Acidobacteria bacterium]|nr:hypothetical protein [Acidobacteriota bacterium]